MQDITTRLKPDSPAGRKLLRLEELTALKRTEIVAEAIELYYRQKRDDGISAAAEVRLSEEEVERLVEMQGVVHD